MTGECEFLQDAVHKALTWMDYQSPGDRVVVAQTNKQIALVLFASLREDSP